MELPPHRAFQFGRYLALMEVDANFCTELLKKGKTLREAHGTHDKSLAREGTIKAMEFTAWNESLPFTRRPDKTSLLVGLSTELTSVFLALSVDKQGKVRNLDAITSFPESVKARAYASDAVSRFTFRPDPTASRWITGNRTVNLLYRHTP